MGIFKNIKLTISYDGTDYAGWQRQANNKTIQGILEDTLRKITDEKGLNYMVLDGQMPCSRHRTSINFKTTLISLLINGLSF